MNSVHTQVYRRIKSVQITKPDTEVDAKEEMQWN